MNTWFVYLIRCKDGSLYTGITTDVAARLAKHREGKGAKRLRGRGPLELVYHRAIGGRSEALKAERKIKRLSKSKKEQLIAQSNGPN